MDNLISIIVPIYNVKEYLGKCLDSIANQTYVNLEIILIDDGSFDGSSEICDKYAGQDSRFVVVHRDNGGLVSARKCGIQRATGKYAMYVDGDDWIESDIVEKLHFIMTSENVDVAMCGYYEEHDSFGKACRHGIAPGKYDKSGLENNVYPKMISGGNFFTWGIFPTLWGKMYKRQELLEAQLKVDDRITMGEDSVCSYSVLLGADSIFISDEVLYHYRQSDSSMIKASSEKGALRDKFRVLYDLGCELLGQYGNEQILRQWREYVLFMMIPRADEIIDDMPEMSYLFPYKQVNRGDSVVIYGMGLYGRRLSAFLNSTGFCKIEMCVDGNYEKLSEMGIDVVSPDRIADCVSEKIIVPVSFGEPRGEIVRMLREKYPEKQIVAMPEKVEDIELIKEMGGLC